MSASAKTIAIRRQRRARVQVSMVNRRSTPATESALPAIRIHLARAHTTVEIRWKPAFPSLAPYLLDRSRSSKNAMSAAIGSVGSAPWPAPDGERAG